MRQFLRPVFAVVVPALLAAAPSTAQIADPEGAGTSGVNDTAATATPVGGLPGVAAITINGWVDQNNADDLDFFGFTIAGQTTGVFFDIDLANDFEQIGDFDDGLDAELWVFDSAGRLIASNDDSDFFQLFPLNDATDPGSDPYGDLDPFVGEVSLDPGSYTAAVGWFDHTAVGETQPGAIPTPLSNSGVRWSGTTPDTSFNFGAFCFDPDLQGCVGQYRLQIRTTFAPEPGVAGLALGAWVAISWIGRRRRRTSTTSSYTRCS